MPLSFIIGRAGSGKTYYCLQKIAARIKEGDHHKCILLVPEQASFHMEKNLLWHNNGKGTMNAQVYSFQRLAWRVLQETGGGHLPIITDLGRMLLVRRILEQYKDELKLFKRVMDTPGFIQELVREIKELKDYKVEPHMLEKYLRQHKTSGDIFQDKLEDLLLVFHEYNKHISQNYLDTADFSRLIAAKLPQTSFLQNAEIWLDGFYGFTPQEYDVISSLFRIAAQVNITLCLDEELLNTEVNEYDLFFPTWETYKKLNELATEKNCCVKEIITLPMGKESRFSDCPALAFLERSIAGDTGVYNGISEGIKIAAAANRLAEVEGVAREIIRNSREKGYRYREMAVLVRDFGHYSSLISTVFARYDIPFFLDMKRPLQHHPLLDLLQGVMELNEKGWYHETVFRILKTDLLSLSRQETDLLENYCLAHGIRGNKWKEEELWTYRRHYTLSEERTYSTREDKNLRRVNKSKNKAVVPLRKLQERLGKDETVREYVAALYEFLDELKAAHKLEQWSLKAENEGELEEARRHELVWDKVIEMLEQMVEVLGEEKMGVREFSHILSSGIESLEMGLIPPSLDQVLCGSIDRSRKPDLKAVFVLGANEGVLPACRTEGQLFTDEEITNLEKEGLIIGSTSDKKLFAEQYLVYIALTRASSCLWVSYALADAEGKALSPSSVIAGIKDIFNKDEEVIFNLFLQPEPGGENDEEYIASINPTAAYLASILRQTVEGKSVNDIWWHVYNWYQKNKDCQEDLARIVEALFWFPRKEKLSSKAVQGLYGTRISAGVSRLESFKACPFSYYLSYGLRLQERPEYRLEAPDLGQFFHAALERSNKYLIENGLNWLDLETEEIEQLVTKIIGELIPLLRNELLLSTSRYRFLTGKLKRSVLRAIWVLREHEKRGTFRPVGLEISFGENGQIPGLQVDLGDGSILELQGRIDRVDAANSEEASYLRVIDYKSGRTSLTLLEIYYGLKMQLLAYMNVILKNAAYFVEGEVRPGGVLYFRIGDPFLNEKGPLQQEEAEKRILKELKLKGYILKDLQLVKMMDNEINGYSDIIPAAINKEGEFYKNVSTVLAADDFAHLLRHIEEVIKDIGRNILSGNVEIKPYRYQGRTPCAYCSYKSVCWFDPGIPGNEYLTLKNITNEMVCQELGVTGGEVNE